MGAETKETAVEDAVALALAFARDFNKAVDDARLCLASVSRACTRDFNNAVDDARLCLASVSRACTRNSTRGVEEVERPQPLTGTLVWASRSALARARARARVHGFVLGLGLSVQTRCLLVPLLCDNISRNMCRSVGAKARTGEDRKGQESVRVAQRLFKAGAVACFSARPNVYLCLLYLNKKVLRKYSYK